MKTRTGKIARLPKKIRDELNRRLQNGNLGSEVLAWLNDLPSVRRVLRKQFADQPITEQNLCHWRKGGYADWLRHQETQANISWMIERSDDVDQNGQFLCERLARILTVELAQHTHELDGVRNRKERWKQFREISTELSRLRYGTHYARLWIYPGNVGTDSWKMKKPKPNSSAGNRPKAPNLRRNILSA